jgi:hypothetical protein
LAAQLNAVRLFYGELGACQEGLDPESISAYASSLSPKNLASNGVGLKQVVAITEFSQPFTAPAATNQAKQGVRFSAR